MEKKKNTQIKPLGSSDIALIHYKCQHTFYCVKVEYQFLARIVFHPERNVVFFSTIRTSFRTLVDTDRGSGEVVGWVAIVLSRQKWQKINKNKRGIISLRYPNQWGCGVVVSAIYIYIYLSLYNALNNSDTGRRWIIKTKEFIRRLAARG